MFKAASTIGAGVLGIVGGWAIAWSVLPYLTTSPETPVAQRTTRPVPAGTASPYAAKPHAVAQRRTASSSATARGPVSAHRQPPVARTVSATPRNDKPIRIVRMDSVGSSGFIHAAARGSIAADVKVALARDIQKELHRAGCPISAIDGDWGERTRSAMTRFVVNANAALPVEKPDVALLALLRNYRGNQCGAMCPAGTTPNTRGTCVDLQTARNEDGTSYLVTSAVVEEDRDRGASARPNPAPRPAPALPPRLRERRTAQAEPVLVKPPQHMRPPKRRARRLDEGRMALGGLPRPPVAGTSARAVTPVALPPVKPEPSTNQRRAYETPRGSRAAPQRRQSSRWSRRKPSYRKYRKRRRTSWRRQAFHAHD